MDNQNNFIFKAGWCPPHIACPENECPTFTECTDKSCTVNSCDSHCGGYDICPDYYYNPCQADTCDEFEEPACPSFNSADRICTCHETYTTGRCSGNCSGTQTNCSTNSTETDETKDTINSNKGSDTFCYSYSSSSCSNYRNQCPNYDGWAYNCPGHRDYNQNSNRIFRNYFSQYIILKKDIDDIEDALIAEINARKNHLMYTSLKNYSKHNSDLIKKDETDIIDQAISNIRILINSFSTGPDSKDMISRDFKTINQHAKIEKGNIGGNPQFQKLEKDINSQWVDCICYADCTAYGLWKYTTCTCNINCKCNYKN